MKNKLFYIVGILFFVIGIGMIIGGVIVYKNAQKFISTSQKTTGVVTDLILSKSGSSNSSNSFVYYPVVQFQTQDDQQVDFQSSVGSNPASYNVGDKIEVQYDPKNPRSAKINDFMSNWFGTLILGFMGIVFATLGGIFAGITIKANLNKKWLLANGTKISTQFIKIEINTSYKINGSSPYVITTQCQNPENQQIYTFESENIWYDPKQYITSQTIDVLVDPKNYKKYYMDISFLPKQA